MKSAVNKKSVFVPAAVLSRLYEALCRFYAGVALTLHRLYADSFSRIPKVKKIDKLKQTVIDIRAEHKSFLPAV